MIFQFTRERRPLTTRKKANILFLAAGIAVFAACFFISYYYNYNQGILTLPVLTFLLVIPYYFLHRENGGLKKQNRLIAAQCQYLANAVTNIEEGVIVTDDTARIHYMNPAAEKLTGIKLSYAQNRQLSEVYCIENESTGKPLQNAAERVLKSGKAVYNENNTVLRTPSSQKIIITNSCNPLYSVNGEVCGTVLLFNSNEHHSKDSGNKKQLHSSFSEVKYHTLAEQASEAVFITDNEGNLLEANEQAGVISGYSKAELRQMNIARLFPKSEYEKNFPLFQRLISGQPVFQELSAIHKNKTQLTVFISAKKLPNGTIMALVRDLTGLRQTEKSLHESEQLNTSILTSVATQIAVINESGLVVTANKAWNDFAGEYKKTDIERCTTGENFIITLQLDAACGNENAVKILEGIEAVRAKKAPKFEYEYSFLASGKQFWFRTAITPFAGNCSKIVICQDDITVQKEAEIETRNYRFALEQSCIVDVADRNGVITYVNDNFCEATGYSKEEVIGNKHKLIHSGYHTPEFYKDLIATISAGKVWNGEIKNRTKDGKDLWVNTTIVPCTNGKGKPEKFISIRLDITQRNIAEKKMQQAIERFNFLTQATSDTIWDWDVENDKIHYNNGISSELGYTEQEVNDIKSWWKQTMHKDDIELITAQIEEAFAHQKQTIQLEYRFKCKNGNYKFIYDRAFILYNHKGNPYRIIGAMQDVTYIKEEEQRISKAVVDAQESERQYLGMELHDNINQLLTGTLLMLGAASYASMKKEDIVKIVCDSKKHLSTAVEEIRNLSHRLAPAAFTTSLQQECELLIDEMNRNGGFESVCQFTGINEKELPSEVKICLYRILQEQLSNICKHSKAKQVQISLLQNPDNVILTVTDDGVGFNPQTKSGGIGLGNIKKRTGYFSGSFTLTAAPGKGCSIKVVLPFGQVAAD